MSPRANVRSLDAIREFRPSVRRFEDDVMAALSMLRTELNRTLQWLDHDCPSHWQQQIRNGYDSVAEARTTLTRKSMMTVAGHRSDCIDEKKALAKAKQQLEFSQAKLQLCRQWSIKAHRAADEYTARIGRAEQALGQGIPKMMSLLEKMVLALESYASVERASRTQDFSSSATATLPETSAAVATEPAPPQAAPREPVIEESAQSQVVEPANNASRNETRPEP
jgi:exonuclease VII large subunit